MVKRLLAVSVLGLVGFAVVCRQRLFLRDPIATVTRDGVGQKGVEVMINYSNDALLLDGSGGGQKVYLVQGWNKVAEAPSAPLRCLAWTACLTDADQASAVKLEEGSRGRREPFEGVTMTNRRVKFVDEDGALVEVRLR